MSTPLSDRMINAAVLLIVGGTAFAFGAVYPWVYWPTLVACGVLSAAALWIGPRTVLRDVGAFVAALGGVALAILAQLVPLPPDVRQAVSPGAERLRDAGDLQHVAALIASVGRAVPSTSTAGAEPLSVDPTSTLTALAFLVVLGLFIGGLVVHLARNGGPERLVPGLIAIGVVLVIAAIVQQATFNGRIYGFWQPQSMGAHPFGPFVNRNHFAGWMIMATPVGLGYVLGLSVRAARDVKADWHHRFVWLASAGASRLVLAAVAISVLAGSVLLTLSRSGTASLLVALLMVGIAIIRTRARRLRSAALGACVALVVVAALGWAGLDAVLGRFSDLEGTGLAGRRAVWRDTRAIAADFPITGSGLNTFATAVVSYETPGRPLLFTEAHNEYLQLVSEGGLLVSVPAAVVLVSFFGVVRRRFAEPVVSQMTRWIRVGAVAGLLAIGLQAAVEFSLQIPANAVLFSVLCAIALHRESPVTTGSARNPSCV